MSWRVTVRTGPRVERTRHQRLIDALDHAETEGRAASHNAPRKTVDVKIRRFSPEQQVFVRVELTGPERVLPKVRAGIDIRGDGSAEAWLGRMRRQIVEQRGRESPYDALARLLRDHGVLQDER